MGNHNTVSGVPISQEEMDKIYRDRAIRFFEELTDKRIKIAGGPNVTDFIGFIAVPKDESGKTRTFPFHLCSEDINQQISPLCSFYEATLGNINTDNYSLITLVCEIDNLHRYTLKGRYLFHDRKGSVRITKQ